MRSAAADSLLLLLFLVGDLEDMAVAAFADLVGDDRIAAVILVAGGALIAERNNAAAAATYEHLDFLI